MKSFRLIVAIRLAIFQIGFNFIFADDLEIVQEELSGIEVTVVESDTSRDFQLFTQLDGAGQASSQDPQDDMENTEDPLLSSEGQTGGVEPHPNPLQAPSKSSPSREDLRDFQSPGEGSHEVVGEVYGEVMDDLQNEIDTPMDPHASFYSAQDDIENTQDLTLHTEGLDIQNLSGLNDLQPQNINLPNLIISEIYRLGSSEWIEITNLSDTNFSGKLSLSGAKSSLYTKKLNIPAYSSIVLADKSDIGLIDTGILLVDNVSFSINDSEEFGISLIYSGTEIDFFTGDGETVLNHQVSAGQLRPSFQKIYNNGREYQITTNEDIYNITGSIANPGKLVIKSGNPRIGDGPGDSYGSGNYGNSGTGNSQGTGNEIGSGNVTGGDSDFSLICSNVQENIITISEVYRGGNGYQPFIELSIHQDVEHTYDSLSLSGSLLAQALNVNLDNETSYYNRDKLQKNTRLILTTQAGPLTEAGLITIVLQPNLELNNFSGELELYGVVGQSRQVLDIVKITTGSLEKSNYHSSYIHLCGDRMDNVKGFSPGFDESALRYFSSTSSCSERVVEVVKYAGGGGGCSCPTKAELCGNETGNVEGTGNSILSGDNKQPVDSSSQAPQNDENGQDSSLSSEGQSIKIISLEPKSPESITLQSFLSYDIDFKNHKYYLKTSTANNKKYIDGILHANTIDTFTKNFGFLDAGACVYLYSGDNQLDSYCYSLNKSENEKNKQEVESFNPSDYQISITNINYNPDGSDAGNESITIKLNSSKSLDLSKIKMKVNSTNKNISGILEPYSSITLKGSFGFPNSTKDNSDVVVTLFYDNYVFARYTYNPNKPKIEIPDEAVKVYSVIDGDTFRYRKDDGSLQSVRLLGVDAPESNTARYRTTECFGKEAKTFLTNLIKNQYITLEFDSSSASSDAYGRMLAYVYLDGKLVNETLIAEGYAKEYTYKTAYSHQSDFKQAEENAKKSKKGLRSSTMCGKSIEEEPEARGVDYEKFFIKISDVIYDPDGTDEGNEIVQLIVDNSQISSVGSIDFSDDFSLTISPRSEYSTGTTKNKKLSEFGIFNISSSGNITLKGNFGLPNNRATCVSLNQGNYTFDTQCYNPNGLLSDDEIEVGTGDSLIFRPNVKIQSIIPNPSGKDSGKEEITLLRIPNEDIQDFSESQDILYLSSDFSLLINGKTKKKLNGNLIPNQNITIKGSFGFPNSASCVSLLYKGEMLDEFCYGKASDGVKFNSDNTSIHEIPAEELAIVKKITLVKQGDKLCVSYNKNLFSCKSIPNSTTEKNKKQLSMQNTFISELENYIKSNYSAIYYNSELKDYFNLYSEAKKTIKSGNGDFTWDGSNISLTNIQTLLSSEYEQAAKEFFVSEIQSFLPGNVSSILSQIENKYNTKIVEKSDLKFLSLVG